MASAIVNDSLRRSPANQRTRIRLFDVRGENRSLEGELSVAIRQTLSGGVFVGGPVLVAFESEFAEYCRSPHCVGVGNGTDALFLALKALNIGRGDEVITTALSFVATAQAITRTGATPRFVDIEPATCNIDPRRIPERVSSRTRAIVPVHLFGHPADMTAICRLAKQLRLAVVEDAAQAHGARDRERIVGSCGDAGCFSFYPTKNLAACGDGGAVVTQSPEIARAVRDSANHASIADGDYSSDGINSRLDAIQAAILRVKLRRLDVWNRRRREIARLYEHTLTGLGLGLPLERTDARAVYHVYAIRIAESLRDDLQGYLSECGIESRVYYPRPIPFMSGFRCLEPDESSFPEAMRAARQLLALPCHSALTDSMVECVAGQIRKFMKGRDRDRQSIH